MNFVLGALPHLDRDFAQQGARPGDRGDDSEGTYIPSLCPPADPFKIVWREALVDFADVGHVALRFWPDGPLGISVPLTCLCNSDHQESGMVV
jgi:hypothetical protein